MTILSEILSHPVIATIFSISLTGVLGLFIGSLKIGDVRIGVAGALFAGILLSYFGLSYDEKIIGFLRDFGLVLFVYSIGMQVGSGFLSAFKKNGLFLNLSAFWIILGNLIIVFVIKYFFLNDPLRVVGLYCGSVTNTPALASSQDTFLSVNPNADISLVSSSYAISYPGAIFAIILAMILLKRVFKIDSSSINLPVACHNPIESRTISVENPNLDGIKIKDIPAIDKLNVIVSRVKRGDEITVAFPDTVIKTGDLILAVGKKENLEEFEKIVGKAIDLDLRNISNRIINTRVIVTNKSIIGKKIYQTSIPSYGVVVTRVSRADVEFLVSEEYEINFADQLVIVGEEENVKRAAAYIGNSPKELNHPDLIPIFIGIIVGVVLGMIPFSFPFITKPVKLGLAGGLLISAIFFSNLRHIGRISWYIPPAANIILREFGIVIFLSCVGLKSGESFFATLFTRFGVYLVLLGFLISFLPAFVIGFILIRYYKQNYLGVCGLISGAMTDPPALAWASGMSESNLVAMYYASVYPLSMFLRIITAQILVYLFYA